MKCKNCGGTGWVEGYRGGAASWTPSLMQCPAKCNISGYSAEVQRRLNNPEHVTESPVLKGIPTEWARRERPQLSLVKR